MPPEAFEGQISRQWDVWSAGVLLYELLAGRLPFPSTSFWELVGAIHRGERAPLPPGIPGGLVQVVDRALQRDRKERYACPRELRDALRQTLAPAPPAVPRDPGLPTDPHLPGLPTDLPPGARPGAGLAPGQTVGERAVNERDGAEMVWVPPGEFPMGSKGGDSGESPVRTVRITRGFWLYRTPVTNAQYRKFLEANPEPPEPEYWYNASFNAAEQPVVGVSWEDAAAYCRWAEGRLPTEAEWEYAARGPEGRKYPWGNQEPTAELAVFGQDWRTGRAAPVGSKPAGASWCGALDLAGNVWEWCEDWYDEEFYRGRPDPDIDPVHLKDDSLQIKVLRGGSWYGVPGTLRSSYRVRGAPGFRYFSFGFRGSREDR